MGVERVIDQIAESVGNLVITLSENKSGNTNYTLSIEAVKYLKETVDGASSLILAKRNWQDKASILGQQQPILPCGFYVAPTDCFGGYTLLQTNRQKSNSRHLRCSGRHTQKEERPEKLRHGAEPPLKP